MIPIEKICSLPLLRAGNIVAERETQGRMPHLETDQGAIVERLRQEPLTNLVLLKYIQSFRAKVLQLIDGEDTATLVITDHRYSAWDHKTYPDIATSVFVASTKPTLTRALVPHMPDDRPIIIKLFNDADRDVFAEQYELARRMAFLSFTGDTQATPDPEVRVVSNNGDVPFSLFSAQGHDREWLAPMFANGTAFACTMSDQDQTTAACFAFHIDVGIWEIGGVYVEPEHRGQGLATRLVQTTMARLQQQKLTFRYRVADTNIPSIGLARKLGLYCFFTGTHYLAT
jgi:RimJ/RimL family protein N-acetyltransferase